MALSGEGFDVVGLSLFGHGPVDGMHLEPNKGWTALYGLNGSGKSSILNGVADVLAGITRHKGNERSCVHIALDEELEESTDPLGSFLIALRASLAAPLGRAGSTQDDQFITLVGKLLIRIERDGSVVEEEQDDQSVESSDSQWFWQHPYGEGDPVTFSLIPSGSPGSPEWEVYLSTEFTEELRERAREVSAWWNLALDEDSDKHELIVNRPIVTRWLSDERHWSPAFIGDRVEDAAALDWPVGLPIPMRRLATIETAPVLVIIPQAIEALNAETRRSILAERFSVARDQSLVGAADESTVVLADWLTAHRERLEHRANSLYRRTFRDPPRLVLDLKHPDQWFVGEAPEWRAHRGGADFPFDRLSNSQQRWASLSISSVLAQRDATRPSLLVVDEPESGLHRSAEAILPGAMRALVENGSAVLTATHSPALLAPGNIPGGRLLHVVMAEGRTLPPKPIKREITGSLRNLALTSGLGLTASDLLSTMRVAVWVEGEHDVAVLRHFLRRQLEDAGAHLFPLHGAVKAPALADASILLDVTDATLVIIVDGVPGVRARELWDRAQAQAQSGNGGKAKATLAQLKTLRTAEGHWLADLGMRAVDLRRLYRIVALPLSRFDIICYLPVELLVPGAPSWGQLHHEYEQHHPRSPDRPTFKSYLATSRDAAITTETITSALSRIADTPDDIQLLGADIERLGLLPPSDPLETAAPHAGDTTGAR